MSSNLRPFATIAVIAASCFWACEPDLGALSSNYDPNASGTGGTGGTGGTKPDAGGTGGVSGSNPTGGTGGASAAGGTGGDGAFGGAGDEAGASGAPPAEGGTGGSTGATGGTSGTGGTGTTSTCANHKRDANESDVDCGGTSKCGGCDSDLRCTTDGDCISDFCNKGHCADPTCKDGFKNEGETGVDCGGPCNPCDNDVGCDSNDDCISAYCLDNVCTDHCTSGIKEADETDKDCGGATCPACDTGKRCSTASDCLNFVCSNNKCQAPTCSDQVANQGEGDVDCGAVCASEGKWCTVVHHDACNLAADCDTSVCTQNKCAVDTAAAAIQLIDIIDDFEAANSGMLLPTTGGRQGNWYGYDDMTTGGTHTTGNTLIPNHRGANSARAMHTFGSGFTNWGAGIGADLNHGSGPKSSYDASFDDGGTLTPYAGITFWARSDTPPQSIAVVFPDGDTDPSGGICTLPNGCDHHYLTSAILGADWQRFTVLFANLMLESGTSPPPGPFDPTRLVSVQFRVNPGAAFDYWVDDVAFVRP